MINEVDIDQMKADRELDARVAEEVMGCKTYTQHVDHKEFHEIRVHCLCGDGLHASEADHLLASEFRIGRDPWDVASYSTNIADAWQVVERLIHDENLLVQVSSNINVGKLLGLSKEVYNLFQPYSCVISSVVKPRAAIRRPGIEVNVRNQRRRAVHIVISAETAPLAICRAALKAVQFKAQSTAQSDAQTSL